MVTVPNFIGSQGQRYNLGAIPTDFKHIVYVDL